MTLRIKDWVNAAQQSGAPASLADGRWVQAWLEATEHGAVPVFSEPLKVRLDPAQPPVGHRVGRAVAFLDAARGNLSAALCALSCDEGQSAVQVAHVAATGALQAVLAAIPNGDILRLMAMTIAAAPDRVLGDGALRAAGFTQQQIRDLGADACEWANGEIIAESSL